MALVLVLSKRWMAGALGLSAIFAPRGGDGFGNERAPSGRRGGAAW